MIVSFQFFIKFNFCPQRILLVFLMNPIDSIDCFLVLSSNLNLGMIRILFPLSLFLIKLLKFPSQLISFLFLILPMPFFFTNKSFVSLVKMLIVVLSLFILLLLNLNFIFDNFFGCILNFILKFIPGLDILLLFFSIKVKLIFGVFDCIINIVSFD